MKEIFKSKGMIAFIVIYFVIVLIGCYAWGLIAKLGI